MLVLSLLLAVVPANAAQPAFDQAGPSLTAFVEELKAPGSRERGAPEAPEASDTTLGLTRFDTDCVRFLFKPEDADSEAVWLRSQEWEQQCRYDPNRGQSCWDEPRMLYHERAWITIPGRKALLPWEKESFRVCLRGPWLYFDVLAGAYGYSSEARRQDRGVNIVLTPKAKEPMGPDPEGLSLASFDGTLRVLLADKWAGYYQGESTVVTLTLKHWGLFGSTILEKELSLEPSSTYALDLMQWWGEFRNKPKAGDRLTLKWGFRRVGRISTDKQVKKDGADTVFVPRYNESAR